MEILSDRVVDAVLDEVHRTRQRAPRGPWRARPLIWITFAAAALAAVVALGGIILVFQRGQPSIVGPGPTIPSVSPSQTADVSASPTPSPTPEPDAHAEPDTHRDAEPDAHAIRRRRRAGVDGHRPQRQCRPRDVVRGRGDLTGMGQQCGTVTPSVVPPDTTMKVDLPAAPEEGEELLDLGEPASGRRGIVVPDLGRAHEGPDPRHRGRPDGLARSVGGSATWSRDEHLIAATTQRRP